ncbi:MAG: hypothetical protein ACI4FZ_07590 [Lachnospiraceae bacterium]
MKILIMIAFLFAVSPEVSIYAAEDATVDDPVVTESLDDEKLQYLQEICNDFDAMLPYVQFLEQSYLQITAVIDVLKVTNSLLLILVTLEFMRLVRGWTKGGRHKDGYTG